MISSVVSVSASSFWALLLALTVFAVGFLVMSRRSHRDRAKQEAEADLLRATVAASLDGIITSNEDGVIVDFNDAAERILGWTRDEIMGQKMEDTFIPHQHRDAHAKGMLHYLKFREPHVIDAGRIELTALRKTGEEFPIELNITCSRQRDGDLFIGYLRDISEQKISEQKLITARDRAESTDRAKSKFLTLMSHEMRTPLNGILGVLDLLSTTNLNNKQKRFVQVAAASGEILLEHVNEALDITRIESGDLSLSRQVFSLEEQVSRIISILRPLAEEKGLKLELELEPSMARSFFADASRLGQILTNLIGNAIKFTNEGMILVKIDGIHGAGETAAEITVMDTGPGIAPDDLESIFEEYVVLARAAGRQTRGDGLGLSISRKVARLMGGDLNAQSELGNGSSFILSLPLERASAAPKKKKKPEPLDNGDTKSVLIVEDNNINRSVLKEMLNKLGHRTTEVENGLEGLKAANAQKFDIIIMDISMPFMDGIETTRRIREGTGPNRETYILGLTAHGRQEYRVKAKSAGMDGFTTKPLRLSGLKENLSKATSSSPLPSQTGPLARDVISELVEALGIDKVEETAAEFFDELKNDISDLKKRQPSTEANAISQILHKLRGAAALLGLKTVAEAIDTASAANKAEDDSGFTTSLKSLTSTKTASRKALAAHLKTFQD